MTDTDPVQLTHFGKLRKGALSIRLKVLDQETQFVANKVYGLTAAQWKVVSKYFVRTTQTGDTYHEVDR